MNKKDFLNALVAELAGHVDLKTMQEIRDYYQEQIDDRVEEGASERTAIDSLGDVQELARQILSEVERPVPAESKAGEEYIHGEIHTIRLLVNRADVELAAAEAPEDAPVCIRSTAKYTQSLENGCLTVEELPQEGGFFKQLLVKRIQIALALPAKSLSQVKISGISSDISLRDIAVEEEISIATTSGDVSVESASAANFTVVSASGDIHLETLQAQKIAARTASGDQNVQSVRAWEIHLIASSGDICLINAHVGGALEAVSSSGDLHIEQGAAASASLRANSGDIAIQYWRFTEGCTAVTSGGDISLSDTAGELTLQSSSGDITGTLLNIGGGYSFQAVSLRGDVHVPADNGGGLLVQAKSVNGDIRLSVEGA